MFLSCFFWRGKEMSNHECPWWSNCPFLPYNLKQYSLLLSHHRVLSTSAIYRSWNVILDAMCARDSKQHGISHKGFAPHLPFAHYTKIARESDELFLVKKNAIQPLRSSAMDSLSTSSMFCKGLQFQGSMTLNASDINSFYKRKPSGSLSWIS